MKRVREHEVACPPHRHLPLDAVRLCFGWLATGTSPLRVDGRPFPGLPNRPVGLEDLQALVLCRSCPRSTRDVVWAELVRRSRTEGAAWTLACVGVALPALTATAHRLAIRTPADPGDVQGEVLAGFLGALATVDLGRPGVFARLRWAAFRAGFAAQSEALDAPVPVASGFDSTPPRPWSGHPDFVLARAVRATVLSREEADLIGVTRLEELPVAVWATEHCRSTCSAYKARRRAELRLLNYLRATATRDGGLDDPVAEEVTTNLVTLPRPPRCRATRRRRAVSPRREKARLLLSNTRRNSGL
ncbi:hypothetical protein [Streptomyces sp. NPDC059009]|uniref:hypothetical protein n=1 Tax=Streptomyces sp. NPDC059009 TaxID=3346694 RepID=UPI0036C455BF